MLCYLCKTTLTEATAMTDTAGDGTYVSVCEDNEACANRAEWDCVDTEPCETCGLVGIIGHVH